MAFIEKTLICKGQIVLGAKSLFFTPMFWPEEPGMADSHTVGTTFSGRTTGPVSNRTHFITSDSSHGPAYLACGILQDVLCHLDENTHNMMYLEVPVVDMPK